TTCPETSTLPELAPYRRRRPERTVLHRVVREHLETFLQRAREEVLDDDPVPAHVDRTFREYLACGLLCHGFARARCPACGLDLLIAFSCKRRGLCPSCEARHRAETAAHLVDHVLPRVPVRHWVLSLPRRVRFFCKTSPDLASGMLRVFLRAVETRVRQRSPDAPRGARFGAVAFEHRGGSFLNENYHWHVRVTEGVFAPDGQEGAEFFQATNLTAADVLQVETQVRRRVLRLLQRRGALDQAAVDDMLSWKHQGGFSLDASTLLAHWDRQGLERLSRYCARPALSLDRLDRLDDQTLVYRFPRPAPDGSTHLVLTPLDLLARLATLLPPPFRHRVRYFGVLAPNARLRTAVVASAGPSPALQAQLHEAALQMGLAADAQHGSPAPGAQMPAAPSPEPSPPQDQAPPATKKPRRPCLAAYCWALLLARLYEALPLKCTRCGAPVTIIAFITDPEPIHKILSHLDEPTEPPPISPARGPPQEELALDQTLGLPEDTWA
ncbi:MAG: transposase, partial [Pseudomonadota bacterium]